MSGKLEEGYREKALRMYPWVCGRCAREFTGKRISSNWELLCLYCHDNEHSRYTDQQYFSESSTASPQTGVAKHKALAGLADLLKARDAAD